MLRRSLRSPIRGRKGPFSGCLSPLFELSNSIGHGDQTDSTILLTALGVDLEGNKEVLALCACAEESKEGWMGLLQDVRTRGATQMDLIVTDGHDGLLAAVDALFAATPRQRCVVHKERNVLSAIPKT
jgi:putative transposase